MLMERYEFALYSFEKLDKPHPALNFKFSFHNNNNGVPILQSQEYEYYDFNKIDYKGINEFFGSVD